MAVAKEEAMEEEETMVGTMVEPMVGPRDGL